MRVAVRVQSFVFFHLPLTVLHALVFVCTVAVSREWVGPENGPTQKRTGMPGLS